MKLRIKGNSLRIRLSKTEVNKLCNTGYLEEHTLFGNNSFIYALSVKAGATELSAEFNNAAITMFIPAAFLRDWDANDTIGFDTSIPLSTGGSLYLLIEKDFQCLDDTTEDQSDNYENPNKTC